MSSIFYFSDDVLNINPVYKMTDKRRPMSIKSSLSPTRTSTPPPRHSLTLTQQFADIIRQYKYYCQHIQRLYKETNKSYNDITNTRVLVPGKKGFVYL